MLWVEIILTLSGAAVGLLLAPVLREFGYEIKVEKFARLLRTIVLLKSVPISPFLELGNLKIADWIILDGFSRQGLKIVTSVEKSPVELPGDLKRLKRDIEREIIEDRALGKPTPYNGKSYALAGFFCHRSEGPDELNTCHIRLKYSEYFNFLTTSGSLDRQIPGESQTVRKKYFHNVDPYKISQEFLFNSFGINIAVTTSDDRLVIVKRGANVFRPEVFNSSVNEGLSRGLDQEASRSLSIYNVGLRGLLEELGVEAVDVKEYKLTSVGFDRKWCQYGALGYARLNVPFSELRQRLCISKDASFEIGFLQMRGDGDSKVQYSVYGIPNSPAAFSRFLEDQQVTITSSGLVCYLLSFLSNGYALRDLAKSFREPQWKTRSFIV
ncbi:MAG: hypothetical protein ACRD9S_19075 [Pyrinomonadaceae bacterium]